MSLANGKRTRADFGDGTVVRINGHGKPIKIILKDVVYVLEFEGGLLGEPNGC